MKKVAYKSKSVRGNLVNKRWDNNLTSKRKNGKRTYKASSSLKVQPLIWGGSRVSAPSVLSIYSPEVDHFKDTVEFVNYIRNDFDPSKDILDFSETEVVKAAAVTLLYSVIEKSLESFDKSVKFTRPKSKKANELLREFNIYKLLHGSEIVYDIAKAESIPVISSVKDDHVDDVCEFIKFRFFSDGLSEKEIANRDNILGSAISETVDNVYFHAYPSNQEGDKKRWWLACDVFKDEIFLAIYDLGVGIPKTVHEKEWFKSALKKSRPKIYQELESVANSSGFLPALFNKIKDEELIYISMLDDFSGTFQEKHGQGSKSIKNLVSDTSDGVLWIYSGKGLYKFRDELSEPELSHLPISIPGTLIQWNIKLP